MNGSYRNSEGYSDPTAGAVITKMMKQYRAERKALRQKKWRPLVYVCSPYAGDVDRNVRDAKRYCRFAVDSGCIPVASHLLYPQFLDDADPEERNLGLFFGNVLMDKCEEVWFFGEKMSPGMKAEYDRAVRRKYRVRRFTENCGEICETEKGDRDGSV